MSENGMSAPLKGQWLMAMLPLNQCEAGAAILDEWSASRK